MMKANKKNYSQHKQRLKNKSLKRPLGRPEYLTARDSRILKYLWRWKIASTASVHEMINRPNTEYYHSLRIGEAAGLAISDITLGPNPINNTVMIRRSVKWDRVKGAKPYIDNNFKNSAAVGIKSRVLHPEVTNYLKKLLPCIQGEQLFTIDGELLTYRQIQYKYNEALKSANLSFTSTHILRCGSATESYNKHGNTALTQMELGVTSMETAQVYAKPLQSKLNDYNVALYENEKYKVNP